MLLLIHHSMWLEFFIMTSCYRLISILLSTEISTSFPTNLQSCFLSSQHPAHTATWFILFLVQVFAFTSTNPVSAHFSVSRSLSTAALPFSVLSALCNLMSLYLMKMHSDSSLVKTLNYLPHLFTTVKKYLHVFMCFLSAICSL